MFCARDAAKRDALAYKMHLVIPLATGMEKVHWVKWEQIAFILYLESYSRHWLTDALSQGKNLLPAHLRQDEESVLWIQLREAGFFLEKKQLFSPVFLLLIISWDIL